MNDSFVWLEFSVPLKNFSLIWRHHHYRWRAATFDNFCILSREGSLACQTYCDMGHPFIIVISEEPWHPHLLPIICQSSCHYLFLRHRSVAAWIRTPNLPLAGQKLWPTAPPARSKFEWVRVPTNSTKTESVCNKIN